MLQLESYVGVQEPAVIEGESGFKELFGGDDAGFGGLAMEAEGLGGDLGDALELLIGVIEKRLNFGRQMVVAASDVEEVGDGFEGIIDLVRDGGGESSDSGEFLALNEGRFCLLLAGEVGDEDGNLVGSAEIALRWNDGGADE